jgi:uncharacterized membrane protein YedE/YeeE
MFSAPSTSSSPFTAWAAIFCLSASLSCLGALADTSSFLDLLDNPSACRMASMIWPMISMEPPRARTLPRGPC